MYVPTFLRTFRFNQPNPTQPIISIRNSQFSHTRLKVHGNGVLLPPTPAARKTPTHGVSERINRAHSVISYSLDGRGVGKQHAVSDTGAEAGMALMWRSGAA